MTSKAALLALLTLWGVGAAVPHQAWADEVTYEQSADGEDDASPDLTNRVWVKAGEDQALQAAIPLINRYLPHPVRLDDPTVAAMRIGGIYDTSDLQALVDSLPKVLPVDLRKRSDGSIVLASKFVPL